MDRTGGMDRDLNLRLDLPAGIPIRPVEGDFVDTQPTAGCTRSA
jgi:hypothetical protein